MRELVLPPTGADPTGGKGGGQIGGPNREKMFSGESASRRISGGRGGEIGGGGVRSTICFSSKFVRNNLPPNKPAGE